MTMPIEEKWSLEFTRSFLRDLLDHKATPKIPKRIRQGASRCLKHFPMPHRVDKLYEKEEE